MISEERRERLKNLDIEEVAIALGLSVVQHKAICFMHNESDPSLSFKNNRYYCFGCNLITNPNYKGDTIALVIAKLGCEFPEACKWLEDNFLSGSGSASVVKPFFSDNSRKSSSNRAGYSFSDIYTAFINMLPYPSSDHYLIKKRKLSENILRENEVKVIPENTWEIKDKLLNVFLEDRLLKSGVIAQNKNNNGYHLFFWKCLAAVPFYQDGKITYLQGVNNEEDRKQGRKYHNLGSIKKPTLYIPKNFPRYAPQTTSIHITESAIDTLSVLTIGEGYNKNLKAVGIVDAGITKLDEFNKLKESPIILVGDFDKTGIEAKVRIYNYLKEKDFDVRSISVFKIAQNFGIPEEQALECKDMNDILKLIKREKNNG